MNLPAFLPIGQCNPRNCDSKLSETAFIHSFIPSWIGTFLLYFAGRTSSMFGKHVKVCAKHFLSFVKKLCQRSSKEYGSLNGHDIKHLKAAFSSLFDGNLIWRKWGRRSAVMPELKRQIKSLMGGSQTGVGHIWWWWGWYDDDDDNMVMMMMIRLMTAKRGQGWAGMTFRS